MWPVALVAAFLALNFGPTPPGQAALAPSAKTADAGNRQPGRFDFLRKTQVIGIGDLYYGYNANGGQDVSFRNFDTKSRELSISMAKLGWFKLPTADSRIGFRVDVQFGQASSLVHAAEPATSPVLHHLEQAYASYLVPLGRGLQVDAGEFVTPAGAEVIEARDNWNYSRSLLFALAIPYYHVGLRTTYAVSDKVTVAGMVVNGWNDIVDNNSGKSFGAQFCWKPNAKLSLVQNYMAGPEQPHDTRDWRQLSDTVGTYALTKALAVMANYDYGRDTVAGVPVRWQGIAFSGRYEFGPRFALAPRVEWYDDPSGFTSGTPQTLREVTATGEMKLGAGFVWRLEARHDSSPVGAFRTRTGQLVTGQTTVAAGMLYSFSSK